MRGEPTNREADERLQFDLPDVLLRTIAPRPAPRSASIISRKAVQRAGASAHRQFIAALVLEVERGALFLLSPFAVAAGVFGYLALPIEPPLPAAIILLMALTTLAFLMRSSPVAGPMTAALALVGLGLALARWEAVRVETRMLGAEVTTVVTGRIAKIDSTANGRFRLTLDVIATQKPVLRFAPQRVRLSAPAIPAGARAGSVVEGLARLFPPSGPLRPGGYDFAYESYFDGIGANGFLFRAPRLVAAATEFSFLQQLAAAIDNLRNDVAARIRSRIGNAQGEIASALMVGTRAGIPDDVNEALRRTGLAHILSISGLHMALVAGSVMGFVRLGFAFFPGFSSRWPVKKLAAVCALAFASVYLLISGADVAARRSYIMLAVMLLAVLADRSALTIRNLAIAAMVTIAIAPHEVVGPSFQMSFAATAALVGAYSWWAERRRTRSPIFADGDSPLWWRAGRVLAVFFVGVAATSIIAGLATAIYGIWHFQRVAPLSLIANLAATPFVTLVMWSGLLAALAMPFGLAGPLLDLMGFCLAAMINIAIWLSERTPIDAVGVIPAASVLLLTFALAIASIATTRLRWLAAPFAMLGLASLFFRDLPDVLVSEDGKLVAVHVAPGAVAVNRSRPNRFTINDWQRALAASSVVGPATNGVAAESRFVCTGQICTLRLSGGARIVWAQSDRAVKHDCMRVALIIVADPASALTCSDGGATIINARTLALHGVASIKIGPLNGGRTQYALKVDQAISQIARPWHQARRFSRAARGLAPYKPRPPSKARPPNSGPKAFQ